MRAGFSVIDITPRVGVELYGFGPYLLRQSKIVRSRLQVRTVALEINGKKAVIAGCDLCKVTKAIVNAVCEKVTAKFPDISSENIMITASHTHSGPGVDPDSHGWGETDIPYYNLLASRIARGVIAALENLDDVEMFYGSAPCRHIGYNRVLETVPHLEEVLKEDWEPAHPELTDTVCHVIKFCNCDKEKELKGFISYFGCHPVVGSGPNHCIHGDYPGVAMQQLMQEFPGSTGIFLQGCEGDVNSGCVHQNEQDSLYALDVFASRFANAVRKALVSAEPVKADRLKCIFTPVKFTTRANFTEEHLLAMRRELMESLDAPGADDTDRDFRMKSVYLAGVEKMLNSLRAGQSGVDAFVHGIAIGSIKLLGCPFEVMQAIKNDIVANVENGIPLVISLCNGSCGYAPSRDTVKGEELAKGGYENNVVPLVAGVPPFADIHTELVNSMIKLAGELDK